MKNFFLHGKGDRKEEGDSAPSPPGDSTAYLTGDERVDSAKIKTLLDTMAELISNQDPETLLRTIVDRSIRLVGAERGLLFLKERDGSLAIKIARDGEGRNLEGKIQYSTAVVKKVMEKGKPVLLKVGAADAADLSQSVVDLKLRAVMCVSLSVKNRVLGVIYVDSRAASREFKRSDLRFFDALASAMAIVLENARLVAETVAAERMKRSLEIARGIQQGLLPRNFPGVEGFDVAGALVPLDATAGDYYDFILRPGERLDLVVGDVSGHGIGPAILASSVRAMLRGLRYLDSDLHAALRFLNEQLEEDTEADLFMTLFLAILDLRDRTLRYGNAGHVPQLLYRAGEGRFVELGRTGVALGIQAGLAYRASEPIALEEGDLLALFTDGVVEARGRGGMFGVDRLKEQLLSVRDRPAAEGVSRILDAVCAFAGGRAPEDDLTLVIVRVLS